MPEKKESERKLLRLSEISLQLDTYDDIFSDFDARPYSNRALSDDFLIESKKASKDKPSGGIELKFLMPTRERNSQNEILIKKRLHEHFTKHYIILKEEVINLKKKGIIMALAGVFMIFIATYLFSINQSWPIKFLEVLLEPAGWFTAWTGLEDIYYTGRELKRNLDFYEKMSKAEINFLSY